MKEPLFCRWCNAMLSESEVDTVTLPVTIDGVETTQEAFWCPDCDGLSFFDPSKDRRRMLLFVEGRNNNGLSEYAPAPRSGLRKRLSPLRYPGGKSRAIDSIYAALLPHKLTTFVELCAGGASLGLSLLDAGKIDRLILNDLDFNVANFWRCVIRRGDDFADMVLSHPSFTRDDFFSAKEILESRTLHPDDSLTRAFSFLLINRLSFGGIQMACPMGGKDDDPQKLLSRWNPQTLADRIRAIYSMRDRIEIHIKDAETFFSEFAGWLPSDSTIFIDPPYLGAGPRLYPLSYQGKHEELADTINTFFMSYPGPDIVLTYDDAVDRLRELYPYADIKRLPHSWSIGKYKMRLSSKRPVR